MKRRNPNSALALFYTSACVYNLPYAILTNTGVTRRTTGTKALSRNSYLLVNPMANDTIDLTVDSDATASPTPPPTRPAPDIDSDDDEDLQRAIALSLTEASPPPAPAPTPPQQQTTEADNVAAAATQSPPAPPFLGILGIDRKAQEAERLARLKRKREPERATAPPAPRKGLIHGSGRDRRLSPGTQAASTSTLPSTTGTLDELGDKSTSTAARPAPVAALQYPRGVVKKTWAFGQPRRGNDIKLAEVFRKGSLQAAVLSSFQWSFDWLFPQLDTKRTRFVLVMHAKAESHRTQTRADFAGIPNVRLCFPNMDGNIHCMHSKLMLLFYDGWMRVVIPTANLVPYDWGEGDPGGVMENTVFLVDLPKAGQEAAAHETGFQTALLYFLRAQGLPGDVIRQVQEYDFSQTKDYGFVPTIGGAHAGTDWRLTGYCGLGRTVSALELGSKAPIELDYVTSSVGSLNGEFMRALYLAATGDDGLSEYALRNSRSSAAQPAGEPDRVVAKAQGSEWREHFRFYYPSSETVKLSKGTAACAGTICLKEGWWKGDEFPRENMRDCVSRRPGLLMHNKVPPVTICSRSAGLTGDVAVVREIPTGHHDPGRTDVHGLGILRQRKPIRERLVSPPPLSPA